VHLSQETFGKMIQNLLWATGYNVIALLLAAGVLALIGILLSPAVGALLMSLSTLIVAINAQLLRRVDLSTARVISDPERIAFHKRSNLTEKIVSREVG
jgi:Cu2+-exporting ATPase